MSDLSSRAPVAACSKPARDALMRLSVVTSGCPQVTLRVLTIAAQQGIVPATIAQTMRTESALLEIVFARGAAQRRDQILSRIEAVIGVESATLGEAARY